MAKHLKDGWFSEYGTLWPGQAFSLEVEKVLHEIKSEFQEIIVYKSKTYGTVLVLDGVIQLTERDWFAYQEIITHVAMLTHPNPKKVCIIGGGDGAVINECVKHSSVEEVVLCEIDQMVCEVSKSYFPQFTAWNDPKVKFQFQDGAKFLQSKPGEFDIIIVDSSDPVGPAESLFTTTFLQTMKNALSPGGIIVQQAENIWLHLEIIKNMVSDARQFFSSVDYFYTTIPTYPGGQIGFLISSNSAENNFRNVKRKVKESFREGTKPLQYYNEEIHSASFILPSFANEILRTTKISTEQKHN